MSVDNLGQRECLRYEVLLFVSEVGIAPSKAGCDVNMVTLIQAPVRLEEMSDVKRR